MAHGRLEQGALYKHLATFWEIQSPSKVDLKVIYPIYPSLKS